MRTAPIFPPGRVLIVEDDRAVCAVFGDMLQGTGLTPVCITNDQDAYAAIPTMPPIAALIVDINLGAGTTGFDVARFARHALPNVAVVYVSGEADKTSVAAFGVPGAAFLSKPFTGDELLEVLKPKLAD